MVYGHTGSEGRHTGFNAACAESDLVTVVEGPECWCTPATIMNATLDFFTTDPELNATWSQGGSPTAIGEAYRNMGIMFPVGDPEHRYYLACDDFPEALDDIEAGWMDGVSSHSPWMSEDGATKAVLLSLCCGVTPPFNVVWPSEWIHAGYLDQKLYGAEYGWANMMRNYPDWADWPVLEAPDIIPTPTVELRKENLGY